MRKLFLNKKKLIKTELIMPKNKAPFFSPFYIPQNEANSLIEFFDKSNGDNWIDNTGWKTNSKVNTWYGVTVSNNHVTGIDLSGDTNVNADIKTLFILAELSSINLSGTTLSEDIAIFLNFNNLISLNVSNTSVFGDVNLIQSLPNLSGISSNEGFKINNTNVSTYTSGTIPTLTCNINLNSLGLSQTEIDNFLVDMDNSNSIDCPIDISNNSIPSQTGLDAITSLESKGCTVVHDTA